MRCHLALVAGCLLLAVTPAIGQPQPSLCADCHLAAAEPPEPWHLMTWESSPHARNNVGCEKCHGGDPTTAESFRAHRGILNSRNPSSPVHRTNLPATCGTCHVGPFVAFQKSRHYEILKGTDVQPPTCVTCHDEVGAELLSSRSLERQCDRCHGEGKIVARPGYAASARRLLEDIESVRRSLAAAETLLEHVPAGERRTRLEEAYQQAEVPLVEAAHDGHAFVFDAAVDRLSVARKRVVALLVELAGGTGAASR